MLRKGDEIFTHVSDKLGIEHNHRTEDGLFSLEEVECMGACGGAPMIAINEDFYECIDIEKVDSLIDNLKNI
jgi:NADH:ubiquinone oxidoreductase subunit E